MVVGSRRSLVCAALKNIKLVNYKDRVIATVVFIEILLLFRLYSVSTLDLRFFIYLIKQNFFVIKCRKFASEARATSQLASQKLLETVVIVRSVFTTRS